VRLCRSHAHRIVLFAERRAMAKAISRVVASIAFIQYGTRNYDEVRGKLLMKDGGDHP